MSYRFAPAMISEHMSKYYDVFVGVAFVGKRLQKKTLSLLDLGGVRSFVDVGCGTGTLAIMAKQKYPDLFVTGFDPGKSVLDVAKSKSAKNNVEISFKLSGAENLSLKDKSVDRIASSLAFHHMPTIVKKQALAEIHRALADDGIFILVDIGKPKNTTWRILLKIESLVEPKEYIQDNLEGRIPGLIKEAGFSVEEARAPYSGIRFWRCTKQSKL